MKLTSLVLIVALAVIGASPANASSFVVSLQEVGNDVVATGSGSINLGGLDYLVSPSSGGLMVPVQGLLYVGPTTSPVTDQYEPVSGFVGPTEFGTGAFSLASFGSGDFVGMAASSFLLVPVGYSSNDPLSDSATWSGATLASLGVDSGVYTWTWNGGADSFTLYAGVPVPEPSQYGFGVVVALAGLFFFRRLHFSSSK